MFYRVLGLHLTGLLLLLFTIFMIYKDRSFNRRVRAIFYASLCECILFLVMDVLLYHPSFENQRQDIQILYNILKILLVPHILLSWIDVGVREKNKKLYKYLKIAVAVNAIVDITSIWTGIYFDVNSVEIGAPLGIRPVSAFVLALIILLGELIIRRKKDDLLEHSVILLFIVILFGATVLDQILHMDYLLDHAIGICTCMYYFHLAIQVYKRDALTHLMNRHNLNYDMAELSDKEFALSMIDVDNFKLINDKYGHQKGDEALVTVVDTVLKHLLPRCRMYRFGGDEFAVLGQKATVGQLNQMFAAVNDELEEKNYHISHGTVIHLPGEKVEDTMARADAIMYENKRRLKSEDIWDVMTGLYNLRGFLDELELLKKKALKQKRDICLVSFDIERLGNINMGYGYVEGNMIITTLADIIKSSLDYDEFAGHLGSDEFIVAFMLDYGEEQYSKSFIQKVYGGVKNHQNFDSKDYTVEINAAPYVLNLTENTSMEESVNEAMSQKQANKENRRKASMVYDCFDGAEIDKEEEALALDVIENNKFRYELQPIVSAKDGSVIAYEALMRTTTNPALAPLSVLRYAAKNGRSYEIERLTFRNVMERMATDESIPENARIFINSIPGAMLREEDYEYLRQKYPGLLKRVVVEITEQSELDDESLRKIKQRQEQDGNQIAIDDFGSGNSNTYTLLRYRPDYIKLDRLLVADINRNTKKQYFVNSIVRFAKENGMAVLAEGVETEAELKMMIRMQVDYIQGYYTAKPKPDPVTEIAKELADVIVSENIRGVIEGNRKIFIASSGWEMSLVQLALEEYTGITVSTEDLKLVGNKDYVADMNIKIKDGLDCRLTLKDVQLNSVDDLPCIEIGEGATLTLTLEGDNVLNNKGIHVPEGSRLILMGTGNLSVFTKGHAVYGIGSEKNAPFGSIHLTQSGRLKIRVDGEQCIGIGGGVYKGGEGIRTESGILELYIGGVEAVGIGCFEGDVPISLNNLFAELEFRVNEGSVIGSLHGIQNLELHSFSVNISGSGCRLSGIGSNYASGGRIDIDSGELNIGMTAQELNLIGIQEGDLHVKIRHSKLSAKGEGKQVLGLGSLDRRASIHFEEGSADVIINSAIPMVYGAADENVAVLGPAPVFHVNE